MSPGMSRASSAFESSIHRLRICRYTSGPPSQPRRRRMGSPDGGPVGIMDTAPDTAEESLDLRPSASVSPENINVFVGGVSDGAPGLRLASLAGRTVGEAIALSVQAWVRNLAYDKEVWVD